MLLKRFFRFVIPSIVSMWIYALYTMVDGIFVSRGVGETALASVNLSMPYVWLIFSVGILFGTGVSTLISEALGRGDRDEADRLFTLNFAVVVGISLAFTVLTLLFRHEIAMLLGATEDTASYVEQYISTVGCFAVFFIASYNMETLVKADGTPAQATVSVLSCGITNVILDDVFVMHFHWGVFGAALATGLAQVTSTLVFVWYFRRRAKHLHLAKLSWDHSYLHVFPLGLASFVTELSGGIVIFLYNHMILSVIGEVGLVSYTVISYLSTLVLSTMGGISQGMQPLVSYSYGAQDPKTCRRLLAYGLVTGAALSVLSFLLCEFCPEALTGIFLDRTDGGAFDYTIYALRLYAVCFLFMGFGVVLGGYFTAVQKAVRSFILSITRGFAFLTAFLPLLSSLFGETGLWLASAASEGCCALLGVILLASAKLPVRS